MSEKFSFGRALEHLKAGRRVAREGWNGKGMWLALSGPNGPREIAFENFWSKHNSEYARQNGGSAKVLPCITMKTSTGEILMGWLASQTDMLCEDWVCLDAPKWHGGDHEFGENRLCKACGAQYEHVVDGLHSKDCATASGFRRYRSHKVVEAAEFVCIDAQEVFIKGGDGQAQALHGLPDDIFARGTPQPGDFIVRYLPDGYLSWSPRDKFVDGYTLFED